MLICTGDEIGSPVKNYNLYTYNYTVRKFGDDYDPKRTKKSIHNDT